MAKLSVNQALINTKPYLKKDEVIETKKLYKVILQAYNNMGNFLQDQGKLDEAIVPYNKALSLKPDYAEALSNMG